MFLSRFKYRDKVRLLFIPVFILIGAGLAIVYNISVNSLRVEHQERLRRTATLTESSIYHTQNELTKLISLFQTNRTLTEYLYLSTVMGGGTGPLKDIITPIYNSLHISSIELYDRSGQPVLVLDSKHYISNRGKNIREILGALPARSRGGFTDISGALRMTAAGPLVNSGKVIGYIAVSKYMDGNYLQELKKASGTEAILYRGMAQVASTFTGTVPFRLSEGKLMAGGKIFSVSERQITGMDGRPIGKIALALSDDKFTQPAKKLRLLMIIILAGSVVATYGLTILFNRTLVKPLDEITAFIKNMAKGDLDGELKPGGRDEAANLTRNLNEMRMRIKASRDLAEHYTSDLEKAVEERTVELKKVQKQLLHAQKMEAVGELAGGVAHDFNNILTIITGCAGLLELKLAPEDPLKKYAENILAAAERATNLTRGLLAFSRKTDFKPELVDLNQIVSGSELFLNTLAGPRIKTEIALCHDKALIMAEPSQLESALINLAANARDAMPGGGLIRIEVSIRDLDERSVEMHGWGSPGPCAVLSISDSGTGMDEATREKIFEPFFTTKEPGKGTGLGLAMVFGIVKQHGGHITVYSEPGSGSVFNIYLPLAGGENGPAPVKPEQPVSGTETILLADDDQAIRQFTCNLLEGFGYRVIEASSGQEAVDAFNAHKGEIDFLLLDVIMPGKNGPQAFREIREIKPGVKALLMSGFTSDIIQEKGAEDLPDVVIKPVSPMELLKKIREILLLLT